MKQGALTQIISMILVVLALIAAIGAIAYFTGGFTGEFKTFYLNVGDRDVLTSASGYRPSPSAHSRHPFPAASAAGCRSAD